MPRKIKELIADLERAGFTYRSGKGSHRQFSHPRVRHFALISGKSGDDAQPYQEKHVREKIEEAKS
jgi:predicted RNA binding protein YcfA (HicA-like mRNA interferase family)